MSSSAISVFSRGQDTLRIDRKDLHGAARAKVCQAMKEAVPADKAGVVLLQGGGPWTVYSTDSDGIFRQEAYFHYLFGVENEGFYGALDLRTGRSSLFMPRLPPDHAVWMGPIDTCEDTAAKYGVDEVHYVDEIKAVLLASEAPILHLLEGTNTDSGATTKPACFDGIADFSTESQSLHPVITECRVHKSPLEIQALQYANDIGSAAHIKMMQECRPGMMEFQLESVFLHYCYSEGGCRHAPYTPICASGPNGAVLHYGHAGAPNGRQLCDGDMMLIDMGCEYHRYGSDITCSFPVNGNFTEDQRIVYNCVLEAYKAVIAASKPGVAWPDMHRLANRRILEGLKAGGFLQGNIDRMMELHVGALFMPHGLGHLLGIDTHDVGGYGPGNPPRSSAPGLKSLRTARVLEEGMVLTVEPGCYFNAFLLEPALENNDVKEFLVKDRILSCLRFGGVRLEDNIVITADGCYSMTNVPREATDVEAVMDGTPWPAKKARK